MLTSTCANCGNAKNPDEYANPRCRACETARNEGMSAFVAENKEKLDAGELSQSDILYAGRMAMQRRAIHPGSNYTDPRTFNGRMGS